jgi:thiol:disulfide interchange protein DsbC
MIFRVLQSVLITALMAVTTAAIAGEPVDKGLQDKISAALEAADAGLVVSTVKTSEIPGLYEVQFTNGPLVYATKEGSHFIVGDLYAVKPEGYVNLAEQRRDVERAEKLAQVPMEEMIVFSPEGKPRAYINVFTDVTCFYCQKLHKEVPQLNKMGVEVRYLAYPRAGLASDGYKQLASAWCADNPQETLTKLKNKQSVPAKACPENPIAGQFQLGRELGVTGTPAIITQDGRLIPGYQAADELMVTLGLN